MLPQMLTELAALGEQTGRFEGSIGRHADAIKKADSLESLAGVVSAMVDETRSVHQAVGNTRTGCTRNRAVRRR
jgi:diguanylate cyclase